MKWILIPIVMLLLFITWQWYKAEVIDEVDLEMEMERDEQLNDMSDEDFDELTIDQLVN